MSQEKSCNLYPKQFLPHSQQDSSFPTDNGGIQSRSVRICAVRRGQTGIMPSSVLQSGEGFPMAVKGEAEEDDELESVPFNRRLGVAVGRGSIVGEQDYRDDHGLQAGVLNSLQVYAAQLEEQLANLNKLAAERLVTITDLESSLNTISQERDLFRAESLKWRAEIDYLLHKNHILEKQVYGNVDTDAPVFEVEKLVNEVSEPSQSVVSQNLESEQIKRQVVDLSSGLPCKSEVSSSILVIPPASFVPDCGSLEVVGDLDGKANTSCQLSLDKSHEAFTTAGANSLSIDEMQSGHCNVVVFSASVADESILPNAIISQSVPSLTSTSHEPIPSLCGTMVKEETFSANGQLIEQGRCCGMLRLGDQRESVVASSIQSGIVSDSQFLSTLSEVFEKTNIDKVCHIENLQILPSVKPIQVKVENVCERDESFYGKILVANTPAFNVKKEIVEDDSVDELDHLSLKERVKILVNRSGVMRVCELQESTAGFPDSAIPRNMLLEDESKALKNGRRDKREACDVNDVPCESVRLSDIAVTHRRKRKRTVTDKLETALEEDVPGLLQILVANGVNLEEVKLYGGSEDVEPVKLSDEDGFNDLETVISKLYTQASSFLKFAQLRQAKETRENYCLDCLVSLVEQAQYLQFRKWRVEWGWCRDLHSFIFVFQNHNRIVLERPEYGFATYFFELVGSFPIDWQIRRLITTMKLANFSRVSLIENKPLLVGDDLTDMEAKILEEYGWIPNTGLGTMLNYCDRVVHDKKNENGSEWRSKIGRLLREGHDGGMIMVADLPKKVAEYKGFQNQQLKLEI